MMLSLIHLPTFVILLFQGMTGVWTFDVTRRYYAAKVALLAIWICLLRLSPTIMDSEW